MCHMATACSHEPSRSQWLHGFMCKSIIYNCLLHFRVDYLCAGHREHLLQIDRALQRWPLFRFKTCTKSHTCFHILFFCCCCIVSKKISISTLYTYERTNTHTSTHTTNDGFSTHFCFLSFSYFCWSPFETFFYCMWLWMTAGCIWLIFVFGC